MVEHVNDSNFDEKVLDSKIPVFVDFWAEWCAPCRMVAPIIEELAEEYKGKIYFAKLDVDENPVIANRFGIMSIPTLIIFKDGKIFDKVIGAVPKGMLKSRLEAALK